MEHLGKIVVADDNRDAADTLAALVESLGYEASVAYDGLQALRACEAERPSLAILDVEMPVMDGCEAAKRMRAGAHPPALIASLSGARLDDEPLKSRCAVFDVRLAKPVKIDELVALLARHAPRAGLGRNDASGVGRCR